MVAADRRGAGDDQLGRTIGSFKDERGGVAGAVGLAWRRPHRRPRVLVEDPHRGRIIDVLLILVLIVHVLDVDDLVAIKNRRAAGTMLADPGAEILLPERFPLHVEG